MKKDKTDSKRFYTFAKHYFLIVLLLVLPPLERLLRPVEKLFQRGKNAEASLPLPVLEWLFCLLLVYTIIVVFVRPILQYSKLKKVKPLETTKEALYPEAARVENRIKKSKDNEEYKEILAEIKNNTYYAAPTSAQLEDLKKTIRKYYKKAAGKIIRSYSEKAAWCVAYNRNQVIDGVLIFIAQWKMGMELIILHGYKPSPMFNACCFFWIAKNSLIGGAFFQKGADSIGLTIGKLIDEKTPDIIGKMAISGLGSKIASFGTEMIATASSIYVAGKLINNRLMKVKEKEDSEKSNIEKKDEVSEELKKEIEEYKKEHEVEKNNLNS